MKKNFFKNQRGSFTYEIHRHTKQKSYKDCGLWMHINGYEIRKLRHGLVASCGSQFNVNAVSHCTVYQDCASQLKRTSTIHVS